MRGYLILLFFLTMGAGSALAGTVRTDCTKAYATAVRPYTPIVGDIMRFDAMFENYATLCKKAGQANDMNAFIDSMRTRADGDVAESYRVMTRVVETALPAHVPAVCKNDRAAQKAALTTFHKRMQAQRDKTGRRLKRSAKNMGRDQQSQICRDLTGMKTEFEKHASSKAMPNPLFEIAFLRGMILPYKAKERTAYDTYRDVLKALQSSGASEKQKVK